MRKLVDRLRAFGETTVGKGLAGVLGLAGVVLIYFSMHAAFGQSRGAALANSNVYMDVTTMQPYHIDLQPGTPIPAPAPSGNTGYPTEKCYWAKDGKIKNEPTYVVLNHWLGKAEPTFCPDCGRLVVGHNPQPFSGMKPPPTKPEYDAMKDNFGDR